MKKAADFVIGVDFGTDSVRALVVDANGHELASEVCPFPRWRDGLYCDPASNMYRQHPLDHIEALQEAVTAALARCPAGTRESVQGIAVDTTGSSPAAIDRSGRPLALSKPFTDNPNAMVVLWKDHTAVREAGEINEAAHTWGGEDYTRYSGGVYSSEWFWSKILNILRADPAVREHAWSWAEHCDWIPALLTGATNASLMLRSRCAAGHKAMWQAAWGGLPSEEFLTRLDPFLKGLRSRLYITTCTADMPAGRLCEHWSKRLGLSPATIVGTGAFDAHMGAVGANIRPYALMKVMGTSTCDMLIAPSSEVGDKPIRGICGQVDGSIIPGMLGMEAGQSAFGDVYAWFRDLLCWPLKTLDEADRERLAPQLEETLIPALSEAADALPADDHVPLALDWLNGRRTPFANQALTGAVTGLSLASDAPRLFRALVEATAYGARAIAERFEEEGIPIREVIALGGVAKKSPFIMQVIADVMGRPLKVVRSDNACALGAAIFAATASGIHTHVITAQAAMASGFEREHSPVTKNSRRYKVLYEQYRRLGTFEESELMERC
jgi:L-ribulokinase